MNRKEMFESCGQLKSCLTSFFHDIDIPQFSLAKDGYTKSKQWLFAGKERYGAASSLCGSKPEELKVHEIVTVVKRTIQRLRTDKGREMFSHHWIRKETSNCFFVKVKVKLPLCFN
jgi:hypothetical protein